MIPGPHMVSQTIMGMMPERRDRRKTLTKPNKQKQKELEVLVYTKRINDLGARR